MRLNPNPQGETLTTEEDHVAAIAALNDAFRAEPGSSWMLTMGVRALPEATLVEAFEILKAYSDFTEDNDPHGERDFGAFGLHGARLFWKIDYYALDLCLASPNPANPAVTRRVLTLMLAEEY